MLMGSMRRGYVMIAAFLLTAWPMPPLSSEPAPPLGTYQGSATLPVRFEYPADWKPLESSGSTEIYTQVQLLAPLGGMSSTFRTYMVVRAMPRQSQGGQYANIQEAIAAYESHAMPHLQIHQRAEIQRYDVTIHVMEISGDFQMPFERLPKAPVFVKGQRMFFEKNDRLYELGWLAVPDLAEQTAAAFAHLLDTLTFR